MTFKIKNLRNNSTTTLTAYLLSRYFRLGVWDYGMVASHDGNTYNPSALYIQRNRREHYGKEYGLEKSFAPILRHKYGDTVSGLPLRPLIIVDRALHTAINPRKVCKRMRYLPETEQDAILYEIEMESKQLRREYAKYYEMYNTSEKEKATHIA